MWSLKYRDQRETFDAAVGITPMDGKNLKNWIISSKASYFHYDKEMKNVQRLNARRLEEV
mgnify:CR=1 FL=1